MGRSGGAVIYLSVVRMAVCEMCGGKFVLPEGDYVPEKCVHCGSTEWVWGVEPQDGVRIRTGVTFAPRRPDGRRDRRKEPGQGSRSLVRRERARKQYQGLKPKPEESDAK